MSTALTYFPSLNGKPLQFSFYESFHFINYKKYYKYIFPLFFLIVYHKAIAQPDEPGELVFVGYNADGSDGFAFVPMVNIPAGTVLRFSDRTVSDDPGMGLHFTGGEGVISWTNTEGCIIPKGTVIMVTSASNNPVANLGSATESGTFNLAGSNEHLYAYVGTVDSPTSFLTAFANDDFSNAFFFNLTGLIVDDTAIELDNKSGALDADVAVYSGSMMCNGTATLCRLQINDLTNHPGNWTVDNGSGDQSQDGSAAEFPHPNGGGTGVPADFSGSFYPGTTCAYSNLTGKDTTICNGDTINLASLLQSTTYGIVQYGIAFGNYPFDISVNVFPSTSTTYFIRDSIAGSCCADTTMITLSINQNPLIRGEKDTICAGEAIDLENLLIGSPQGEVFYGVTFGQYPDTITTPVMPSMDINYFARDSVTSSGCADTAVIMITVNQPATGTETYAGCAEDGYSVIVNGTTYNEAMPAGMEVITNGATNGCDSIVTINLDYKPRPVSGVIAPITLCFGDGTSTELNPLGGGFPPSAGNTFEVRWDFEGEVLTAVSSDSNITGKDAVTGPDLGTITFPSGNGSTDALSANNWNNESGDYFEFCITAKGADSNISGFAFTDQASGTGPLNYSLFSSTDDFSTALLSGPTHNPFNTLPDSLNNLSLILNDGDSLCFRLFTTEASSNAGTWRVDDVTVYGHLLLPPMAMITYNFYSDEAGTPIPGAQGVTSYDPGVTLSGTYNYWFAATDGMCVSDTAMTSIIIHQNPDIHGINDTICAGESVNLETLVQGSFFGTVLYGTSLGDYRDTITTPVIPETDMTYFILDSVTATGCVDTARVNIVVNQQPDITGRTDTICRGMSVNLVPLLSGNSYGSVTYGLVYGRYTDTITSPVSPANTTEYFVRDSVALTGCVDTTIIRIEVNAQPEISGIDSVVCRSANLNLKNFITGNPVGALYYGTQFGIYPDTITTEILLESDQIFFIIDSVSGTGCVDTALIALSVTGPELEHIPLHVNNCPDPFVDLVSDSFIDLNMIPGTPLISFYLDSVDAAGAINELPSSMVHHSGRYFVRYQIANCFDVAPIDILITKCCSIDITLENTVCLPDGLFDLELSLDYTDPCGDALAILVDNQLFDTISYPPAGTVITLSPGIPGIGIGDFEIVILDTSSLSNQKVIPAPYISEIHYDNVGPDIEEGFEISGFSGQNLQDYSVQLYNGSNGLPYGNVIELNGIIPRQDGGCGSLYFPVPTGIQNGPDALALIDADEQLVAFISYEGTVTALGGPVSGQTSADIMVAENSQTPVGASLQLIESGWRVAPLHSFGFFNDGLECPTTFTPPLCSDTLYIENPFCPTECDIGIGFIEATCTDEANLEVKVTLDFFNPLSDSFFVLIDSLLIDSLPYPASAGETICISVPFQGEGMQDLALTVIDKESTKEDQGIFISEIHYDNNGSDINEGVEITGPAGINLQGFELVFYNGSDGMPYKTTGLTGSFDDEGNGCGTLAFSISGLQNGPDGIALISAEQNLLEFISYEGSFMAISGPAAGSVTQDIGVSEDATTLASESLQKSDHGWLGPIANSFGQLNNSLSCRTPTRINICADTVRFDAPDCPLFNLSLTKSLTDPQQRMIAPGDTVSFTLEVTNTGDAPAYNIQIREFIPVGWIYNININDEGWMADSTFSEIHSLGPGTDSTVVITLIVADDFGERTLSNQAEITSAALRNGGPPAPDEDDIFENGTGADWGSTDIVICHLSSIPIPIVTDHTLCNPDSDQLIITPVQANPVVLEEDFETDGQNIRYTTSIPEFTDGAGNYFTRTDGTNTAVDDTDLLQINGTHWFGAQDIDAEGGPPEAFIYFTPRDIRGLCDLNLSVRLAEDDATDGNEDWDGTVSDDNYVHFDYSIDGSPFINGIHVESSNTSTNTAPKIDTDFDGIGDGIEITNKFETFQVPILQSGSSIVLRIRINLEDGDEDIAIDDISILGQPALYKVYDNDPYHGGLLLYEDVASFEPILPAPADDATYWITTDCNSCEGMPASFTIFGHPNSTSLACPGQINIAVSENCTIEDIEREVFYNSEIAPIFMNLNFSNSDGEIIASDNIKEYIGQTLIYQIRDSCMNIACWGNVSLESKRIPLPILKSDTVCCMNGDPIKLIVDMVQLEEKLKDQCIAPFENLQLYKTEEGTLCDTIKSVYRYLADFEIDGIRTKEIVYEHSILTTPMEGSLIQGPGSSNLTDSLALVDSIIIESCALQSFSPQDIATYFAERYDPKDANNNGINEGIPFAYPHIVKDSIIQNNPHIQRRIRQSVTNDTLINIDGIWINADVVLKDTVYDTINDISLLPYYQELVQSQTCNLEMKYLDTYDSDCLENSKLIRKWTLLDWCNGEAKEFTQFIILKDRTPPSFNILPTQVEIIHPDSILINGAAVDMDSVDVLPDINIDLLFQLIRNNDPNECSASFEVPEFEQLKDNCTPAEEITFTYQLNDQWINTNPDNPRLIHNIPPGSSSLTIYASDNCGNTSSHTMTLFVFDEVPPTVICKDEIHLNLVPEYGIPESGRAFLTLELLDQGSYDECGEIILVLAQRLDNKFFCNGSTIQFISTEAIEFCCDDIGQTIPISLTYFDNFGNASKCWSTVFIEEQITPIISIKDTIISCTMNPRPDFTGYPEIIKSCTDYTFNFSDNRNHYDSICGNGYIDRTWIIQGHPEWTTTQRITIEKNSVHIFDPYQIRWPRNYTGEAITNYLSYISEGDSCTIWESKDTSIAYFELRPVSCTENIFEEPAYPQSNCGLITKSFEDLTTGASDKSCNQFIRQWTIIDWCSYRPNELHSDHYEVIFVTNDCDRDDYYQYEEVEVLGLYRYDQIIKITDTISPTIHLCSSKEFFSNINCVASVQLNNRFTDLGGCPSKEVHWEASIYNSIGEKKVQFYGSAMQEEEVSIEEFYLDNGHYEVHWQVTDQCHNGYTCIQQVDILDTIPPTLYCIQDLSTAFIEEDAILTIWASDFDLGSKDNCQLEGVYFKKGKEFMPSMIIDCQDIITLHQWSGQLYGLDIFGNIDSCLIRIDIQNRHDYCDSLPTASLSGRVYTINNNPISNFTVMANEHISANIEKDYFTFESLPMYQDYRISVSKNDDLLDGVTVLDLVLMQQHILGTQYLKTPYLREAADVNNDGLISTLDLVAIRRALLGITDRFPNNESWKFIDASIQLDNNAFIEPSMESMVVRALDQQIEKADFIGIKIGDVSEDYLPSTYADSRTYELVYLYAPDQLVRMGEKIELALKVKTPGQIMGLQFELLHDGLELLELQNEKLTLSRDHIFRKPGSFKLLFTTTDSEWTENDDLFRLVFRAKRSGRLKEMVKISTKTMPALMYRSEYSIQKIKLSIEESEGYEEENHEFRLAQNKPNPFNGFTVITVEIKSSDVGSLEIFDLHGNRLYEYSKNFSSGTHHLQINQNDIGKTGVLFYQFTIGGERATKRMIALN